MFDVNNKNAMNLIYFCFRGAVKQTYNLTAKQLIINELFEILNSLGVDIESIIAI